MRVGLLKSCVETRMLLREVDRSARHLAWRRLQDGHDETTREAGWLIAALNSTVEVTARRVRSADLTLTCSS